MHNYVEYVHVSYKEMFFPESQVVANYISHCEGLLNSHYLSAQCTLI